MVLKTATVPRLLAHAWKATKQASKAPADWEQWNAVRNSMSAQAPAAWDVIKMLPVTCDLLKHVLLHKDSSELDAVLHDVTAGQVTGLLDTSFGTTMFVLVDPFAVVRKRMGLVCTFVAHGEYDIITSWR